MKKYYFPLLLGLFLPFLSLSQTEIFAPIGLNDRIKDNPTLREIENRHRFVAFDAKKIDFSKNNIFNLFDDTKYDISLQKEKVAMYGDVEVWVGRAADKRFDHLPHYRNSTVVVNPKTNKIYANIQTEKGYFQIMPTDAENVYRIRDYRDEELKCEDFYHKNELELAKQQVKEAKQHLQREKSNADATCGNPCYEELDQNGKYVLDIFMGYSNSAATHVGDINAHAALMVQEVNNGLSNSNVSEVYMRLVGTGTTSNNPGIITSVLNDCYTWFASEITTYKPDFIGVFQTPTGASGEAGGWAGVGGYSSVNSVNSAAAVFRHEIGHNVGGGHCAGDGSVLPYAHGINNGNWRTHLCGNTVNFYSTPLINDNLGNPIGDAATADMARTFRERAKTMAQNRQHKVPYFVGDACTQVVCLPSHFAAQNELIRRVEFNTLYNDQNSTQRVWQCATTAGLSDYTNLSTTVLRGSTHLLRVTSNHAFADSKIGFWIDWNNNKELEASERVGNFVGLGPWSTNVTVPNDAYLGDVLMRVRLQYDADPYDPDPCVGTGYNGGETEDYTVTVNAALGVELLNFEGENTPKGNLLTWQTISETNNKGFEIQKSLDNINFQTIGFVKGAGNSQQVQNYSFTDPNNNDNIAYYRLRQVDIDGTPAHSPIVALTGGKYEVTHQIFPNPTTGQIWVNSTNMKNIIISNSMGQIVQKIQTSDNYFDISELTKGIFTIQIVEENKHSTHKIIKQ